MSFASTQSKTGRKSVPPPPFGSSVIGSEGPNSWTDCTTCNSVSWSPDDVRVRIRFIRDANLADRGHESLWRSIKQCSPPDGSRLPRQQRPPNSRCYRSAFRQECENGQQGGAKVWSFGVLCELV